MNCSRSKRNKPRLNPSRHVHPASDSCRDTTQAITLFIVLLLDLSNIKTSLKMSDNVTLRFAQRSDIPELARIGNAANSGSVLHRRMAPLQDRYPTSHYHWRLNIIRERFAKPDMRMVVAEDSISGEILGLACWGVMGQETALYKKWVVEGTWSDWLESKLIWAERKWCRYVMDQSIDYEFLNSFMAVFQGPDQPAHPACLHVHLIVVAPNAQSRGIGRILIDWGKELATKEELPLYLEANLEATGFYEKGGFSRLSRELVVSPDGQESIRLPVFAWEGEGREGRWLERDVDFPGPGERWKWRDDVLIR